MAEELDKYEDDIDKLIDTGKEKGYLTYGEVNDLLPGDITSPDELDDLMTTINTQGIDVLSGESRMGDRDRDKYEPEAGEESDDVRSWISRRGRLRRPMTQCACICARWVRFRC